MVTPDRKPYAAVERIKEIIDLEMDHEIDARFQALADLDRLAGLLEEAEALIAGWYAHEPTRFTRDCAHCALLSKLRAERGEGERG